MDEDLHDEDGYIRDVTRRGGKGEPKQTETLQRVSSTIGGGRRTV